MRLTCLNMSSPTHVACWPQNQVSRVIRLNQLGGFAGTTSAVITKRQRHLTLHLPLLEALVRHYPKLTIASVSSLQGRASPILANMTAISIAWKWFHHPYTCNNPAWFDFLQIRLILFSSKTICSQKDEEACMVLHWCYRRYNRNL